MIIFNCIKAPIMKTLVLLITLPFLSLNIHVNGNRSINLIKKDAKKLAEYYRQRALRGESVASLAKLYSEDPGSASNGGQYNNITKGMFVPAFEKVAYSLKPGEISEVFETEFGFHFIQLISRKGDVLSLRHLLITRD
jgi:peptidyl-prolyl cis-trans isomerase SurA